MDRPGDITPLSETPALYRRPRFSPDGKRVALQNGDDIWIHDIGRHTMARLTTEGENTRPVWSPDGQWVAFGSRRGEGWDLNRRRADFSGPAEVLLTREFSQLPSSWSPDGGWLVYTDMEPAGKADIWALPLEGDREPRILVETPFWDWNGKVSPDGRWMAYVSNESGPDEIYVQPFPDGGRRWPISTGGGNGVRWSASGRELFYLNGPHVMVVEVETEAEFQAGAPRLLFKSAPLRSSDYDVAPDGQRFVMVLPEGGSAPDQINVVLNWFEELKRLAPTD